jgi:hypothetical protein
MKNNTILRIFLISIIWICFSYSYSSIANPPIKGTITYHETSPVGGYQLFLYDNSNTLLDSTFTNSTGKYIFNNIPFGDYILRGDLDQLSIGVGLEDAYMIEQYLLGNDTLSAFQLFTADVDDDGAVTWDDYNTIIDWINQYGTPFPAGEWKFEEITISFYSTEDGKENDTKVTSTGDVNGGGLPDKLTPVLQTLNSEQIVINGSDIFEIPIYLDNNINLYGFHFSLKYDSDIIEVIDIYTLNENGITSVNNNRINITCRTNNELFEHHSRIASLRVRLKSSEINPEAVSFAITGHTQFINSNGEQLKTLQLSIPAIKVETKSFDILGSYPNPFTTSTTIDYITPEDGFVTIGLYNTSGQLVNLPIKEFKEEGAHQYHFDGSNLPEGIYFYRVIYSGNEMKENIKTVSMIKSN